MDEVFLRQAAAMQANLKMLESQSDRLTELADMKELRQFKMRLTDYLGAHVAAGNLPSDSFEVVKDRLRILSNFFAETIRETEELKSWRRDWLKVAPEVDLATLHAALRELEQLASSVPAIQARLCVKLSPLDWAGGPNTADLHSELLVCAQCLPALDLLDPARRRSCYDFAHGVGLLAQDVSKHFNEIRTRISHLITLHAFQASILAEAALHLANNDTNSAKGRFDALGEVKFIDLTYDSVKNELMKQLEIQDCFKNLESFIGNELTDNGIDAARQEMKRLRDFGIKPESELGHKSSRVLKNTDDHITAFLKRRKKTWIIFALVSAVVFTLLIASINAHNNNNAKKAELAATKAKEQLAAAEAAYAKSSGNRAGEEKIIEIAPGVTMTFCWCPAGKFAMGSPTSEAGRSDEENQVEVTLSQGFWMAKTEVTQVQWQAVMGENPSEFKGANRPVENVSWNDAQEFLTKVNAIVGNSDGGKMALPTEGQWEYACRAGKTGPYSGGTLDEVAWYEENSGEQTHPVGEKKPNAWGLHDMHGNVGEWCSHCYGESLPGGVDPKGPDSGTNRVIRGGSWSYKAYYCRVAGRYHYDPSVSNDVFGFRVVRSSVP
jgi:formylglycine-generating enzyme required for sulfatase activity